ncbi:hypothetical protein J4402_05680 [Candidatus Pacearchaeota archaeon]|nr:hypothetical protein [Candidatus Pacearchaeota archaeon]
MNKKADIPTTLLLVIALVLSVTAIFILVSFAKDFQSSSTLFSEIAEEINFNQKYITQTSKIILSQTITSCPSCTEQQLKEKFKTLTTEKENTYRYEGAGNFFAKIRNSEFEIKKQNNIISLEIKDISIISERGNNKIERTFDVVII